MAGRVRRVEWTRAALEDLEDIAAWIAEDAPGVAVDLVRRVLDASRSLRALSRRGRVVPERSDPRVRELLVLSYRMIYSVEDERVLILGLLHQRQTFEIWVRSTEQD